MALLEQLDEFSRSRFRLESRYQHVLVDEFQDTSRAQWRAGARAGAGLGRGRWAPRDDPLPPSIFIVGDRKQSIYGFRDAEVAVLDEAARFIDALRPERPARAGDHPQLPGGAARCWHFVNDVFERPSTSSRARRDAFRYYGRRPVSAGDATPGTDARIPIGLVDRRRPTPSDCADAVAAARSPGCSGRRRPCAIA